MAKFIRRNPIIEAVQFVAGMVHPCISEAEGGGAVLTNDRGEQQTLTPGDWIADAPNGGYYAISDATFQELYKPLPAGPIAELEAEAEAALQLISAAAAETKRDFVTGWPKLLDALHKHERASSALKAAQKAGA